MKHLLMVIGLGVLLTSCIEEKQKPTIVDFADKSAKYRTEFIRAVSLQDLFNAEAEGLDDFQIYFDTVTYMRSTYDVLHATKDNYEIFVKPEHPRTSNFYFFTKDSVYILSREPVIIKNWSGGKPSRN